MRRNVRKPPNKTTIVIELTNGTLSGLTVDGVQGTKLKSRPAGVTAMAYEIEIIGAQVPSHTCVTDPVTGQWICT